MLKTQSYTPQVYSQHSRDFQVLGRAFDIVFNYLKTNTDLVQANPLSSNSDEKLIDLLTMTLGFKSRHKYNIKQLTAMCSAFVSIVRQKGSLSSIETAINTLLQAEGISEKSYIIMDTNKANLSIHLPSDLKDTNLLKDLLIYILPAGVSCNIVTGTSISEEALTEFKSESTWKSMYKKTDANTSVIATKDIADVPFAPGVMDNSVVVGANAVDAANGGENPDK